jgi:hypothetical protein
MVGEEVARDSHLGVRDRATASKEVEEKDDHRRVGVHELDRVSVPRPFGPIEHATGGVKDVATASPFSS